MRQRKPLGILIPAAILDLISFAILLPILPLYAERLGANKWELMLVMGGYSAVQFVFAPWLGRLSDRIGRRPVLVICYLGSALSCLVLAAAHSVGVIILSRVITGATGGNLPVAQAVVADALPPERRTRGMGLLGMAMGIGFIVGPASGAVLYRSFGPVGPPLLAGLLSAASMVIAWFYLPETRPRALAEGVAGNAPRVVRRFNVHLIREAFGYPVLGTVLLVALLSGVAFSTFEATFSQFLAGRFHFGPGDVGPVFALIGIVIAVVQGGLIGPLARAIGEERLVVIGTLCLVVALAFIPQMTTIKWLIIPLIVFSFGRGVLDPSMSGLVPSACPPERIGAMLGVFQSMMSLGRIIGPVWGQYARGTFGDAFPYRSAAGLTLAALLLAVRGVYLTRRRNARLTGGAAERRPALNEDASS